MIIFFLLDNYCYYNQCVLLQKLEKQKVTQKMYDEHMTTAKKLKEKQDEENLLEDQKNQEFLSEKRDFCRNRRAKLDARMRGEPYNPEREKDPKIDSKYVILQ